MRSIALVLITVLVLLGTLAVSVAAPTTPEPTVTIDVQFLQPGEAGSCTHPTGCAVFTMEGAELLATLAARDRSCGSPI